jgi:hypothetical protein
VPPPVPQMPTQERKNPVRGRRQGRGTKADAEGTILTQSGRAMDQVQVCLCRGRV